MAVVSKECRVCGKIYKACRTANVPDGIFRWQDVACSPECGGVYLQRVMESRGLADTKKKDRQKKRERPVESEVITESSFDDTSAEISE